MPTAHSERDRLIGVIFLVLTLAGWSSSPLFLKYFVNLMDPWTSNGWRYGLSALFWLPYLVIDLRGAHTGIWRNALWPALFNAAGQTAFAWILYLKIDPGMMTFLLRAQIVFVTIGAFTLFRDERALARLPGFWMGLGLVVLGTIGTIFLGHAPPAGVAARGVIMGLSSGALFGCYALCVRKFMAAYSAMSSFAVISLYTATILCVPMFFLGQRHGGMVFRLDTWHWGMLVISALAGIALGHVFYYASIARLGVASASSILLLQPFITAGFSWYFFNEQLTREQWIAGCVSVLGAAVVIQAQRSLPSLRRTVGPVVAVPDCGSGVELVSSPADSG